jgi:hypothetical protein
MRPSIAQELVLWLSNENGENVQWIVTGKDYAIHSEEIRDVIGEHYRIYAMNDKYVLYNCVGSVE